MKKYALITVLAVICLSFFGCTGATITDRPLEPIISEKSVSDYSCNVIIKREKSPYTLMDANVLAESLGYNLVQANLFKKVGLMMKDADVTLTAVIKSASQTSCSFGSFPVNMTIEYELKGKNLSWTETITTDTDSRLGCNAMFVGAQRASHDDHLAYSKNFALAVKSLSQYMKTAR